MTASASEGSIFPSLPRTASGSWRANPSESIGALAKPEMTGSWGA